MIPKRFWTLIKLENHLWQEVDELENRLICFFLSLSQEEGALIEKKLKALRKTICGIIESELEALNG